MIQWFYRSFFHNEIIKVDGRFTGTLACLESMSCLHSVSYHHQVITSSRSIMGGAAPVYSEKINQEVLAGLSCQAFPNLRILGIT